MTKKVILILSPYHLPSYELTIKSKPHYLDLENKFIKLKKYNSVILNYDPFSEDIFKWYQQLVSESLGKNFKGIMPVISSMPKDNHSVMQLYLDGFKSNFFILWIVILETICQSSYIFFGEVKL